MVKSIFVKVAMALYNGAHRLGITYNEINILVYYLLIPLTWTFMVDLLLGAPITTAALLFVWGASRLVPWGGSPNGATGPSCARLTFSTTSTVGEETII